MKTGRDRLANAIIGGKAQGKSTFIKKLIALYNGPTDKVIILTSQNPPAYEKFKRVQSIDDIKRLKKGVVKYYDYDNPYQMINNLRDLATKGWETSQGHQVFKTGAIVFEDTTNYLEHNPPRGVKNFLVDHRMMELDLFFVTHALRFLPKFVRGMVSTITVFKTAETFNKPEEVRTLGYPNSENLYNAWCQVMNTPKTNDFIQPHITIETGV